VSISSRRIRRVVNQIGDERVSEREVVIERFKKMDLPKQQVGSTAVAPPQVGVTMMDGGRYQRRDRFGEKDRPHEKSIGGRQSWLLALDAQRNARERSDARTSGVVGDEFGGGGIGENGRETRVSETRSRFRPQRRKSWTRQSTGSHVGFAGGGCQQRRSGVLRLAVGRASLAAGFPSAERQAFVADGAHVNWTIQRRHFSRATPILDLMHALSYAFSAALAVTEKDVFRRWAKWIWRGEVDRVIVALGERQLEIGQPPRRPVPPIRVSALIGR